MKLGKRGEGESSSIRAFVFFSSYGMGGWMDGMAGSADYFLTFNNPLFFFFFLDVCLCLKKQ